MSQKATDETVLYMMKNATVNTIAKQQKNLPL